MSKYRITIVSKTETEVIVNEIETTKPEYVDVAISSYMIDECMKEIEIVEYSDFKTHTVFEGWRVKNGNGKHC